MLTMSSNYQPSCIIINRSTNSMAINAISQSVSSISFSRFTVFKGASFQREQVLDAILKHVSPNYILPFEYEVDNSGNSHFLSSTCWNAIRALANSKMVVTIPEVSVQLDIEICLHYKFPRDFKITPMEAIQLAIKKRLSTVTSSSSSLDISNLEKDEVFSGPSNLYFPLWVPQFQRLLVRTLQSVLFLRCINFSHNKISSLFELSKLYCPKLEELNLSYNEIAWSDLIPISPKRIKSLWLEGNPICASPLPEYIKAIKAIYPLLEKLDGVTIYPDTEAPYVMKNSFINLSSHQLVDQYLHHYFNWFSKFDRSCMVHMYHTNASLSVSCNMPPNTDNSDHMLQYLSRNILRMSNYGKTVDSFQTGTSHILRTLSSLPYLQLDPSTTTVDVPYYIDKKIVQICMAGIFRDKYERMYWIGFTFLLQMTPDSSLKDWKIVNQMINITPATPEQTKGAFGDNMRRLEAKKFDPDREEILSHFKELTSLKTSYCEQFLESTSWNMECALQSFVDQYKGDLVPEDAFIHS